MLTQLHLKNFKSWQDTGAMRFAPLTGFFGTNSSGKTSILQFLVMMKQTVESTDQNRLLHTGDKNAYVDLGTFYDLIHKHQIPGQLEFAFQFQVNINPFLLSQSSSEENIRFEAIIQGHNEDVELLQFMYISDKSSIGIKRNQDNQGFILINKGYDFHPGLDDLFQPIKSYNFSFTYPFLGTTSTTKLFPTKQVSSILSSMSDHVKKFEELFKRIFYLGPLREYPSRTYLWSGEKPQDVGTRGQWTNPALLATPSEVTEKVAHWLKKLGLIHSFDLRPIAKGRREHEAMVKLSPHATEVPITDVGFGVSQILPVLTLCYYVPEKSIVILEQPEIHLHPAVQANLADVFIEVIKTRNLQIILESHSEHLLRRLQRRVAEEQLQPDQAALYFTSIKDGVSQLSALDLDEYGNIGNWPANFFGDELGELTAMTEAAIQRQTNNGGTA